MDIRKRLETDLKEVVSRLRQLGGSAALEELLDPGEHCAFADEVDEMTQEAIIENLDPQEWQRLSKVRNIGIAVRINHRT